MKFTGSTVSMLGVGNFANGAISAAFTYLFNEALEGMQRYVLSKAQRLQNAAHIAKLDKRLQGMARAHIHAANKSLNPEGYGVVITHSYRSVDEQNKLYAQGRTLPGEIITRAPGGYSAHNYGLAYDVVVFGIGGQEIYKGPLIDRVGIIGIKIGLDWGGAWTGFKDFPHFQYPGLPNGKEMYRRYSEELDIITGERIQ